jgi:hypothetical protein
MSFRPSAPLVAVCAVGASLLLVACGGSAPKATATQDNEEKFVKFAKCLREHGIEVATSTASGGGGLKVNGRNPQAMAAAQSACKRYQPSAEQENLTPQQKVEHEEEVMKFAKCMREHGVDVHASAVGGAVKIGIEGGPGHGPNPESPTFQAAQKACQGLLPLKRGGPGPGGRVLGGPGGPAPGSVTSQSGGGKESSGAGLAIGG